HSLEIQNAKPRVAERLLVIVSVELVAVAEAEHNAINAARWQLAGARANNGTVGLALTHRWRQRKLSRSALLPHQLLQSALKIDCRLPAEHITRTSPVGAHLRRACVSAIDHLYFAVRHLGYLPDDRFETRLYAGADVERSHVIALERSKDRADDIA